MPHRPLTKSLANYDRLTPTEQELVRLQLFERLTVLEQDLATALAIAQQPLDELDQLRTWVTDPARFADFTATQQTDLGSINGRFLDTIVAFATAAGVTASR